MSDLRPVLEYLIRPIVRVALHFGFSAHEVMHVVRRAFLDEAEQILVRKGEKVNISRLSVITGLSRQDIRRTPPREAIEPQSMTAAIPARVVALWETKSPYADRAGPRTLSFEGSDSEFSRLVAAVTTNINPGTVLFELERSGAVKKEGTKVRLLKGALDARQAQHRAAKLLARGVDALSHAVLENMTSDPQQDSPNLHIHTEYDNIRPENLPEIRIWLRKQGFEFHKRIREYLSEFDKDVNPKPSDPADRGAKVSIGGFSFVVPSASRSEGPTEARSSKDDH